MTVSRWCYDVCQEWTSLGVHEASTVSLGGVKALRAAANLDIGDYSLAARYHLPTHSPITITITELVYTHKSPALNSRHPCHHRNPAHPMSES